MAIEEDVKARFPSDVVTAVKLLEHGDDPAIEPGRVGVRVVIDPERVSGEHSLESFHHSHVASIRQLSNDLAELVPQASGLEFTDGSKNLWMVTASSDERPRGLTPVMARLDPVDLDTLDTLIRAGIAPNRAEAVRWALARIRERPAYEQIRERSNDIEQLKAQL